MKRLEFTARESEGNLIFKQPKELEAFLEMNKNKHFYGNLVRDTGVRTLPQNNSIHLYCTQVANELINTGRTIQDVVAKIRKVEIIPTMDLVKDLVWRQIQIAQLNKKHSADLDKLEVNQVYEVMSMFLAKNFEISLPFPSDEERQLDKLK